MNASTTKVLHAMALLNAHGASEVTRSAPPHILQRAAAWLKTLRARRAGIEDRVFLYRVVDQFDLEAQPARCAGAEDRLSLYRVVDQFDLERRIRALDRRRAQSGYGVGGTRF